jgi:hypothetical protein
MEEALNPSRDSEQQTGQGSTDTKPTMQDLWLRHPEVQNAAMIEAPGIPYLRVVYVFCGFKVTLEEFDTVLNAFNRLAGTHYTRNDIAGVQIAPDGYGSLINFDNRMG